MIRITPDMAKWTLTMVLDILASGKTLAGSWEPAYERLYEARNKTFGDGKVPYFIEETSTFMRIGNVREMPDPEAFVDALLTQIQDDNAAERHATKPLLDQVVELLMNPNIRNTINRDLLRLLRRQLLLPEEAANLRTLIEAKVKHCASCGKEIAAREALVYHEEAFFCFQCMSPGVVACGHPGCTTKVPFAGSDVQRRCEEHPYTPKAMPRRKTLRAPLTIMVGDEIHRALDGPRPQVVNFGDRDPEAAAELADLLDGMEDDDDPR
jgi:hypothetical protein